MNKVWLARIVYPVSDHQFRIEDPGFFLTDEKGVLLDWGPCHDGVDDMDAEKIELKDENGQWMVVIPPLVDVHFHWVQDLVSDMDKDHLLEWLEQFVFPEEAKFCEEEYARTRAREFSQKLKRAGTLAGAVYGSIHDKSVQSAFDEFWGTFFVGNVIMTDRSPQELTMSLEEVEKILDWGVDHFAQRYVFTPRFAISCNPESMKLIGNKMQASPNNIMQTHLSETKQEIEDTLSLYRQYPGFEDVQSYLEIYDRCSLVGPRSIFGHCIHLTDKEKDLLAVRGSWIAHCPTSNAPHDSRGLGSGLFDFEDANEFDIQWALASDTGAGPYLSMLDVMHSFVEQHEEEGRYVPLTMPYYRGTVKGLECLGLMDSMNWQEGNLLSFVAFDGDDEAGCEEVLQSLLDTPRESKNTLPKAVCYEGQLEVFSS